MLAMQVASKEKEKFLDQAQAHHSFCADVGGYTKLMEQDEEATFATLQRCRSRMRDLFDHHNGREINTWGDAVIAEFDSVVEAVRCAIAVQAAVDTENLTGDVDPMLFHIGINLGDVIDDGSSVYGDGVNAAARLESVYVPGNVLVSETVALWCISNCRCASKGWMN